MQDMSEEFPALDRTAIEAAAERIRATVIATPSVYSRPFSNGLGAETHLKLENLQHTGSFKIRGATNFIAQLDEDDASSGVVTASSGNHAQAVALAAANHDIDAKVVMPESTPRTKVEATRRYGGTVVMAGEDYGDATVRARDIEHDDGRVYVPTFDDWDVIAGQGTIGLEVLEAVPDCSLVVVPVGGGGLVSGITAAVKQRSPHTRVVGVQANGASTVARSLEKGSVHELSSVDTVADGIAINSLGTKPFEVIERAVDDVVTVSDAQIRTHVAEVLERGKVLVEGAGATPLAALAAGEIEYDADDVVVPVLSGGNIDMTLAMDIVSGQQAAD